MNPAKTMKASYLLFHVVITIVLFSPGSSVVAQGSQLSSKVTESTFTLERTMVSKTGLWIWWTAVMKNPNDDYYCRHPSVTVTAYNAKNVLVGTYDKDMVAAFTPKGGIGYTDNLEVLEEPTRVELTPIKCDWQKWPTGVAHPPAFTTSGVRVITTGYSSKLTAVVANPFPFYIRTIGGQVLFRNSAGKLVGGEATYIRNLSANGNKPIMEDLYFAGARPKEFSTVELIAYPNSLSGVFPD